MKKVLVILAAGAVILSSANYASAEGGYFKELKQERKGQFKQKRQELRESLNLTEEQREKAKQIRMEARPDIEPIIEQKKQKWLELKEMKEAGASKEEMQAKREEIKALREKANSIREQNLQKFESILDPEQKAVFGEFKGDMKQKREQFRENRKQHMKEIREKRRQGQY